MKIHRENRCIMLFKWEWCDLLLLCTKENANLSRVDVAFSTPSTIISGDYLRFLGATFRHVLAETTTGRCSLKEADPKLR